MYYNESYEPIVYIPSFEKKENKTASNLAIASIIEEYNDYSVQNITEPPLIYLLPDGSVHFVNIDYANHKINYTFSVNDNQFNFYHRKNNFTRSTSGSMSIERGKMQLL